eukprot:394524-Rhodomonas_salina.3
MIVSIAAWERTAPINTIAAAVTSSTAPLNSRAASRDSSGTPHVSPGHRRARSACVRPLPHGADSAKSNTNNRIPGTLCTEKAVACL